MISRGVSLRCWWIQRITMLTRYNILQRPEPPATHKLVIATLARVFTVLTSDKPTLIREIVVPNLPATIGYLLNFCSSSDATPLAEAGTFAPALEALRDILQSHPVTFRPFAQKSHTLILSVLSSPSSSSTEERLAREIFALLHLCASGSSRGNSTFASLESSSGSSGNKATAVADEWARGFKAVIQDAHSTLNVLFRCILEDSNYSRSGSLGGAPNVRETTVEATGISVLGLSNWRGVIEGVERVSILLRLLQSFFTLSSAGQVSAPIGQLIDLTTRVFSVAPSAAQINSAVERAERELVFARLPELQKGALDLLSTIVERIDGLFAPFTFLVVDQISYVFSEQSWNTEIRTAVYTLLNSLLERFGTGWARNTVHSIHSILATTCDDLLPPPSPAATTNFSAVKGSGKQRSGNNANGTNNQNFHADAFLSVLPMGKLALPGLVAAAETLLATALAKLPTAYIRSELRTKMDRTAVLTENTEAMLASVLFPPLGARRGGSILPHLVGASGVKGLVVEGVVRPRMPVVWTGKRKVEDEDEEMEEDEDGEDGGEQEEDDDEEDQGEQVNELGSSKNPYTEETLAGESPYKRQKTELATYTNTPREQADDVQETRPKGAPILEDLAAYAKELDSGHTIQPAVAELSMQAASIAAASSVAAGSSSFTSPTIASNPSGSTSTEVKHKKPTSVGLGGSRVLGGGDSDDDMEIPEIVIGDSSSEDGDDE